jgi:hypothetical protein
MMTAPEYVERESATPQIEANWIKQRQKARLNGARF